MYVILFVFCLFCFCANNEYELLNIKKREKYPVVTYYSCLWKILCVTL